TTARAARIFSRAGSARAAGARSTATAQTSATVRSSPVRATSDTGRIYFARFASSSSTSLRSTPLAASRTYRWKTRSAASATSASRSPPTAARPVSTASSPTFCAHRATPASRSDTTYEPSGRFACRSRIVRQSAGAKHERDPVWHAGPAGRTRTSSASPSQSSRISSTASVLPEVLPLCQSCPRERLQNHASPVSRVSRSASASIHASMSTRPSAASWTIAAFSSGCIPERDSQPAQLLAQRDEPLGVFVEDGREERRLRHRERFGDVARVPGAARGDHRERDGVAQRGELLEVVAVLRPVTVDGGDEQLAGAALLALAGPLERSALGVARRRVRAHSAVLGVDRDDDRLAAEGARELLDQSRARERGRVDADLVRTRFEQGGGVVDGADAAAERERDRHLLGDARGDADRRRLLLHARRDVEEDELVRPAFRVRRAELDGVADVAQLAEAHALDD